MTLLLGSGCALFQKPDPELVAELERCQKEKERLEQEYNVIRGKIFTSQNKNQEYIEKSRENAQYLYNIVGRYKSFWMSHAKVVSRTDFLEQDEVLPDKILFRDGTPQTVSDYTMDEKDAYKCSLEPYAVMPLLPLPKAKAENSLCIVVDAALEPMPSDGYIMGFEIMLENVDEIHTIGLAILNEKNEVIDSQIFDLTKTTHGVTRNPVNGHEGWEILKMVYDRSLGDIPIQFKKGEHWGLVLPVKARIPCTYIGLLPDTPEEYRRKIGGDVQVAMYEPPNALKFESPSSEPCFQKYPAGCTLTTALQEKIESIKASLKPNISFAVYSIIQSEQ